MDTFVAIDFETADPKRDSACAIGLVRVEECEIVRRETRLICPPRGVDGMNYRIHGLSMAVLKRHPRFPDVWAELQPVLAGITRFVAHNAAFDKSVLKACCVAAGIEQPDIPWTCTYKLAEKRWPDIGGHKLTDVCRLMKVPIGKHHEAGADAEMCARCLLAMEGLGSADARERAKRIAGLFRRAAATGRHLYGFDSRTAEGGRVMPGKPPANFDRFCCEGDSQWTFTPRGDLGEEPDIEDLAEAQALFEKYAPTEAR